MITALALAFALGDAQPGAEDLALWEGCAGAHAAACPTPVETKTWRTCLEAASPTERDAWDRCEIAAFPQCFDERSATGSGLRLCGAQRVVAARRIAIDWTDELKRRGLNDGVGRMTALRSLIEQHATPPNTADPVEASARRLGSWTAGLRSLGAIRRASLAAAPTASAPSALQS